MSDDARLAAALATGLVENDSFTLNASVVLHGNIVIRNCSFSLPDGVTGIVIPTGVTGCTLTGCHFHSRPYDEMTPLYDLLEESHGRTQA